MGVAVKGEKKQSIKSKITELPKLIKYLGICFWIQPWYRLNRLLFCEGIVAFCAL